MNTVQLHGRGADLPVFLRFGHGPILVQINLQHIQGRYLPKSNSLYLEHHTEKQLVPFLKSLV